MHRKKQAQFIDIEVAGKNFELLTPRGVTASQTGLLNHISLDPQHGLCYKKMKIFHTFGMNFPICAVALDKEGLLLAKPLIVGPSCIFIAPRKCYRLLEVHPLLFLAVASRRLSRHWIILKNSYTTQAQEAHPM